MLCGAPVIFRIYLVGKPSSFQGLWLPSLETLVNSTNLLQQRHVRLLHCDITHDIIKLPLHLIWLPAWEHPAGLSSHPVGNFYWARGQFLWMTRGFIPAHDPTDSDIWVALTTLMSSFQGGKRMRRSSEQPWTEVSGEISLGGKRWGSSRLFPAQTPVCFGRPGNRRSGNT